MEIPIRTKPPWGYWIVAILAFVWNLSGVVAYLQQVMMTQDDLVALPEAQREIYLAQPTWFTAAFAIAVWFGAFGSFGLLLRKKWAGLLLVFSLLGIIVQMSYLFFASRVFEVMGNQAVVLPIFILIVGVVLVFFARNAQAKGWIS